MVLLSEVLNFDFASKYDDPFTDEELDGISGVQAIAIPVVELGGRKIRAPAISSATAPRARSSNIRSSSGQEVADGLEEWFAGEGCDGFVLGATHMPGAYEDFVRLVVPTAAPGLPQGVRGATLRDHLHLQQPKIGDWRKIPASV